MSSDSLSLPVLNQLMEVSDYRSFLELFINEIGQTRALGWADIARRGGFASRSFPREVVLGKKRLTLLSLPKFIKGLGLNADLSDYLRILVEIEHPDCRTKVMDEKKLHLLRGNLCQRILNKRSVTKAPTDSGFQIAQLPLVYAALGSVETGATLTQIEERTGLTEGQTLEILNHALNVGLVEKRGARYLAQQNHLNIQNLKASDLFKKHFLYSMDVSAKAAKRSMDTDDKLFLSSSFSVNAHEIPKLKEELRSLLLKYVDSAEKSEGDKVVSLVASLF